MPKLTQERRTFGMLRAGWRAQLDDYPTALAWAAPKGELLVSADASGALEVFESREGRRQWRHSAAHEAGVIKLSVNARRDQVASAAQDGEVIIWSVSDGEKLMSLAHESSWVEQVSWAPHSDLLASAAGKRARVWDQRGEQVWESPEHPYTVSAIAWLDDETLVSACYGQIQVFKLERPDPVERYDWRGSPVSLAISPDEGVIACGGQDQSVQFWRRPSGEGSMMSGYASKPSSLIFSACGLLLASNDAERATIWSFERGGPEGTRPIILELHQAPLSAMSFTHRGRRLATGCRDGGVAVWKVNQEDGDPIGGVMLSARVEALSWRFDDQALAAIDASGELNVWRAF